MKGSTCIARDGYEIMCYMHDTFLPINEHYLPKVAIFSHVEFNHCKTCSLLIQTDGFGAC